MGLTIMALDDERLALSWLVRVIKQSIPDAMVYEYTKVSEILEAIKETPKVDILFTDIEMPRMSGLVLAKKIKEESPDTYIIFVTGYSQYAVEAFSMHANGYLLKPVTKEQVIRQIEYLKKPIPPLFTKKIRVQCFGNFEVFVKGKSLEIKREKSKELFAYLIDRRGASVSGGELCAILWGDEGSQSSKSSYLRHLYSELNAALRKEDVEDVLVKGRNSYAIDPQIIDCDYYNFLKKDPIAVNSYRGEYMTQYSWAEMTLARLKDVIE